VLHVAEARDELVQVVRARGIAHRQLELVQLARDLRHLARARDRLFEQRPSPISPTFCEK
jgi:hypothetical protein